MLARKRLYDSVVYSLTISEMILRTVERNTFTCVQSVGFGDFDTDVADQRSAHF